MGEGLLRRVEWALHLFYPLFGWAGLSVCLFLLDRCSFGLWFASEPGYYEDGAFGIRIENVVLVVPVKTKVSN